MAIIENKLPILISLIITLFTVYLVYGLYGLVITDFTVVQPDIISENMSDVQIREGQDVFTMITDLFSFLGLQIPNAPLFINVIMGFISAVMWAILILITVAYAREFVGFT